VREKARVGVSIAKTIGNHLQLQRALGDKGVKMGSHRLQIRDTGSPGLPATKVIFYASVIEAVKGTSEAGGTIAFEIKEVREGMFNSGFL